MIFIFRPEQSNLFVTIHITNIRGPVRIQDKKNSIISRVQLLDNIYSPATVYKDETLDISVFFVDILQVCQGLDGGERVLGALVVDT